jgi:hypothetical protein
MQLAEDQDMIQAVAPERAATVRVRDSPEPRGILR